MPDLATIEALFVGPDDSETCNGCSEAVNGNPYTLDDVPEPGSFECMARCRHMVQLSEDAPEDIPTTEWSGSIGFGDAPKGMYYADVAADSELPLTALDAIGVDSADLASASDFEQLRALDATELAQYIVDADVQLDDVSYALGLDTQEEANLRAAYSRIMGSGLDEAYARDMLASGDLEALQAGIDAEPAFADVLDAIADAGFDDADAEQAEILGQLLDRTAYINEVDGRWYLER